jgi:hypothetical protein
VSGRAPRAAGTDVVGQIAQAGQVGPQAVDQRVDGSGWVRWLGARLDPGWRRGEWNGQAWLFTGDLDSPRTAAWACRTPGMPDRHSSPVRAL